MKTKSILLTCLFALFASMTVSAQSIIKGDMNDDNDVTIADVTSLVNVVLGKSPKETINVGGSPYSVDNASVVGTWYAPDGTSFKFNDDGTTTFPGGATYEFMPMQGRLLIYDTNKQPIKVLPLLKVESEYLLTVDYATNVFTYYTDKDPNSYVDLGLPSGTLWATCNIGASSPEDYGDYFAWGETTGYNNGKTTFNWSTYTLCKGSENTITKYCTKSFLGYDGFTDGKTELDLEDDAAYVNWGPAWRMPSLDQFQELINSAYTTTERTTQNGVDGLKITSLKNGNSIFLPAAGERDNSSLNYTTGGYYWTRSLNSNYPYYARSMFFNPIVSVNTSDYERFVGHSVRPVRNTTE